MSQGKVFLLPMILHEEGWDALPTDIVKWIKQCDAFFVEEEKTARRFFKKLWKEMVIDNYIWLPIHKVEAEQIKAFKELLQQINTVDPAAYEYVIGYAQQILKPTYALS